MFADYIEDKGYTAVILPLGEPLRYPKEYLSSKDPDLKKNVFIVDDAHKVFGERVDSVLFTDVFFKNLNYNVVCFSTSAHVRFETAGEVLRRYEYWYFGPTSDRKDVAAYGKSVLNGALPEQAPEHTSRIADCLFDYCGGSMETIVNTLCFTAESGNVPTPAELLSSDFAPRVITGGNSDWGHHHLEYARVLLAMGSRPLPDFDTETQLADLFREGFVAPPRPFNAKAGNLVKIDDYTKTPVTWAHSWQRTYALPLTLPLPTKELHASAAVTTPFDALVRCLPFLDIVPLLWSGIAGYDTPTGGNSPSSEYHFQDALLSALSQALPNFSVVSKYPVVYETDKKGHIDFMMYPPLVPLNTKWGIQLMLNGAELEEHLNRFVPGGIYHGATDNYLVVDCCRHPNPQPTSDDPHYVRLTPHLRLGWDVITLHHQGTVYQVPRDGVLRLLDRNNKVVPAVELASKR